MRVRIACYEDPHEWIIGKFALNLQKELSSLSVEADIARTPDPSAEINHHLIYVNYNGKRNSIDTLMITHVDSFPKFNALKSQLESAALGICMSTETMHKLVSGGISPNKLCYVNPAHDGVLQPRKTIIGIASRTYEDGRKQQNTLSEATKQISPNSFAFKIMGKGWKAIVAEMVARGFEVDYYEQFDLAAYMKIVPSFDYYLYYPLDEGSMGFLDALTAGVKTIVSRQGFHLDAKGGITYPIDGSARDIVGVLRRIEEEKRRLVQSVAEWTWKNYARKHLELWEYLLGRRKIENTTFKDGLGSLKRGTNRRKSFSIYPRRIVVLLSLVCSPITFQVKKTKLNDFLRKTLRKIRILG